VSAWLQRRERHQHGIVSAAAPGHGSAAKDAGSQPGRAPGPAPGLALARPRSQTLSSTHCCRPVLHGETPRRPGFNKSPCARLFGLGHHQGFRQWPGSMLAWSRGWRAPPPAVPRRSGEFRKRHQHPKKKFPPPTPGPPRYSLPPGLRPSRRGVIQQTWPAEPWPPALRRESAGGPRGAPASSPMRKAAVDAADDFFHRRLDVVVDAHPPAAATQPRNSSTCRASLAALQQTLRRRQHLLGCPWW